MAAPEDKAGGGVKGKLSTYALELAGDSSKLTRGEEMWLTSSKQASLQGSRNSSKPRATAVEPPRPSGTAARAAEESEESDVGFAARQHASIQAKLNACEAGVLRSGLFRFPFCPASKAQLEPRFQVRDEDEG